MFPWKMVIFHSYVSLPEGINWTILKGDSAYSLAIMQFSLPN
jgi:hypothetical protein